MREVVGEATHDEENQGQLNLLVLRITHTIQSDVSLLEILHGRNARERNLHLPARSAEGVQVLLRLNRLPL